MTKLKPCPDCGKELEFCKAYCTGPCCGDMHDVHCIDDVGCDFIEFSADMKKLLKKWEVKG